MNFKRTINQYPVTVFIISAFALSVAATFVPVGGNEKFLILATLLVPIPTMVALALSTVTGRFRAFLREDLNWQLDLRWVLIALGIALAARLLTSILALLTGAIPAITVSSPVLPLVIVTYLFALLEEIGWRGFAVRQLVMRLSPFAALLITGLPWSIIHIFFYLAQGADLPTVAQVFVLNFTLTVMVTWVYLRSGQRLWIAVILHGSQTIFGILNTNIAPDLSLRYSVFAYTLIALALLAVDWRMWFTPGGQQGAKVLENRTSQR
jgi:membrane protease YdiL (CAAX protease family)